ncbi:hypothetical protein HOY82DRAFT_412670 [Tuber indicum]|nr:hypothetical protein HOY82DRAFT_412670 [Tuber indicum]
MLDQDGGRCLVVLKRGHGSGLTVGRANTIMSLVCEVNTNGDPVASREWPIYSYNDKSGPFSTYGNSVSGIVDCLGRLGSLTGGSETVSTGTLPLLSLLSWMVLGPRGTRSPWR